VPGGTLLEMRLKGLVYKSIAMLLICFFSFFLTISVAKAEDIVNSETTPPPEEIVDQEQEPTTEPDIDPNSESDPESEAVVEAVPEPTVTEIVTNGGDDTSYKIPLTVSVIYDGVEYTDVYATTNSVITFGNPDGTYWTYPSTPSISIESRDWWALPWMNPDMHFIIRVSDGGFQVDGSYLPYGTTQGEVTNIVITGQILSDGTVSYTYYVDGPLYGGERTGARLNDGSVVSLQEAGVNKVDEPVELAPTPVEPEPEVDPEPEIQEPEDTEQPTEPTPGPSVDPVSPEPTQPSEPIQPEPQPQPDPLPAEPTPEPEPELDEPETPIEEEEDLEPEPPQDLEPPQEDQDLQEDSNDKPEPVIPDTTDKDPKPPVVVEPQAPVLPIAPQNPVDPTIPGSPIQPPVNGDQTIVLDNGVVLPVDIAEALELFDNPSEMLALLFTDPGKVLKAFLNVGADMSPEKRDLAQKGAVAVIIVTQIIGGTVLSMTRGGKQ